MSSSTLDRLLAGLIAAQVVTGLVSLRAGAPAAPGRRGHGWVKWVERIDLG